MFAHRSILREPPRPAVIRENPRAPWLAVGVVCFGAFMGQLDASIVAITFPAVQHEFSAPVAAVQWVSLSYLLGIAAVVAGRYLLPRTRQFSPPGRFDWPGTALLVTSTSALLLAPSAGSGLSLPAWL